MSQSFLMFGSFYPEVGDRAIYLNEDGTYDLEVNDPVAIANKCGGWKTSGKLDPEKLLLIKNFCLDKLTHDSNVQDKSKGLIIQYKTSEKTYHLINDPVWDELHALLPELDQAKPEEN